MHENVQTSVGCLDFVVKTRQVAQVAHVRLYYQRPPAQVANGGGGLFRRLPVTEEIYHQVGPLSGETKGHFPADTPP